MPHAYSLAFLTLHDVAPLDAVRIAAQAGYDMIGLRLLPAAPPHEAPYALMSDDKMLHDVANAMKDVGLQLGDVEIIRLKPETNIFDFRPFLSRAQFLGARHILVAGDDPDHARLTDNFAAFCEMAKTYHMTADLEFMPWTAVPDLKTARKIVEDAGEENGGVLIDALHYDRSNTSLEEIADLPNERIHYVQFCDGPALYDASTEGLIEIARGARLMPGEGGIDLKGLAQVIPQEVTISIEVPNFELAQVLTAHERAQKALEQTKAIIAAR